MSNIIFCWKNIFPYFFLQDIERKRVEITIFIRYHFWWMLLCIWISCTMYTHIEIRHWLVSICKQTPKSIWQLQISCFYSLYIYTTVFKSTLCSRNRKIMQRQIPTKHYWLKEAKFMSYKLFFILSI